MDTNSNWIARQLNRRGWKLERVTILRDSLDNISKGIRETLKRRPDLAITVGGLGPTHDDMTLIGLGRAVGQPLVLNRQALSIIKKRYETMGESTRLTKHRKKMAILPIESMPLPNSVGTAPGVLTKSGRTMIVSLPGVPQEMRAIFKESVIPILKKTATIPPEEAYLRLVGIIESALAPILVRAQRKYAQLYFKSHPRGKETGVVSLIQLHIYNTEKGAARKITEAVAYIVRSLAELE